MFFNIVDIPAPTNIVCMYHVSPMDLRMTLEALFQAANKTGFIPTSKSTSATVSDSGEIKHHACMTERHAVEADMLENQQPMVAPRWFLVKKCDNNTTD
jgi:hypothetical protein